MSRELKLRNLDVFCLTTTDHLRFVLAYDLLTGPLASEFDNYTARADAVLAQAKTLGDTLKFAFNTPTGISDNSIFLDPPRLANSTTNGVATIGTLVMEWTRLSDLTGDPTYGELAQKGESYLINPLNPELGEPFPGLLGSDVSISNGSFVDSAGGWTGGTDSYYEYLIKMYLYDPDRFSTYKDRWVSAVESSIKYLASHPTSRPDLTFLSYYFNNTKEGIFYYSEHCKSISHHSNAFRRAQERESTPNGMIFSAQGGGVGESFRGLVSSPPCEQTLGKKGVMTKITRCDTEDKHVAALPVKLCNRHFFPPGGGGEQSFSIGRLLRCHIP